MFEKSVILGTQIDYSTHSQTFTPGLIHFAIFGKFSKKNVPKNTLKVFRLKPEIFPFYGIFVTVFNLSFQNYGFVKSAAKKKIKCQILRT